MFLSSCYSQEWIGTRRRRPKNGHRRNSPPGLLRLPNQSLTANQRKNRTENRELSPGRNRLPPAPKATRKPASTSSRDENEGILVPAGPRTSAPTATPTATPTAAPTKQPTATPSAAPTAPPNENEGIIVPAADRPTQTPSPQPSPTPSQDDNEGLIVPA